MTTILVVDDEPNVLSAFQALLEGTGHEVLTARHSESALERIAAEPIDLVVMDICLSGLNGLDALQQIKSCDPNCPSSS